jgi:PncC family amidohydrolase
MTNQPQPQTPREVTVGRLLRQHTLTLATAESCTGGLIGHRLTEVAGSSAYFLGGIIAYSNEAKAHLLGVKHETLEAHGAVSAATALEMARGARRALGADIAVSVTGIAGPDGGTVDKPIGLTYIALAAAHEERVERFVWDHDRAGNKWASSEAALQMIQDYMAARVDA